MPHLELHHLAFTVRKVKFKRAVERIWSLLVVVKHKVPAYGRHAVGKLEAQAPACNIHLMDALVAKVAVACVPDPVPVVMKAITREWFQGCWSGPEVIVDAGRNRLRRRTSDRVAEFKAKSASQIDLADYSPIVKSFDCFLERGRRPNLRAMLDDAIVF